MEKFWYSKHWFAYLLLPISYIFRLLVFIRYYLFRWDIKQTTRFPVPVVIVGNLTVGGTGKTPLVITLVRWLQEHGVKPGIVCRGYKGRSRLWPQIVGADSDPRLVGDEAVLLAQATGCPLVAAPDRVAAVQKLLENFDCDMIVSDDGLQHYALGRDVELVVLDERRGFGNGWCLPAGPLREPVGRLRRANCSIVHVPVAQFAQESSKINFCLAVTNFYQVANKQESRSLAQWSPSPVHAVAGIGDPERFFVQLERMGLKIFRHAFPDHHPFVREDIDFADDHLVIMTEKDAVKCRDFVDQRHWVLAIEAVMSQGLKQELQHILKEIGT